MPVGKGGWVICANGRQYFKRRKRMLACVGGRVSHYNTFNIYIYIYNRFVASGSNVCSLHVYY